MTETVQSLYAILLVLGLLGGGLWLLRRRGALVRKTPGARQLRLVERLALGPQHAIHLVGVGEQFVLIATSPGACQAIDVSPAGSRSDGSDLR